MKSIIGIGTLALALSTTTWAHESASKVEYKGDTSARKVCLSIVSLMITWDAAMAKRVIWWVLDQTFHQQESPSSEF